MIPQSELETAMRSRVDGQGSPEVGFPGLALKAVSSAGHNMEIAGAGLIVRVPPDSEPRCYPVLQYKAKDNTL